MLSPVGLCTPVRTHGRVPAVVCIEKHVDVYVDATTLEACILAATSEDGVAACLQQHEEEEEDRLEHTLGEKLEACILIAKNENEVLSRIDALHCGALRWPHIARMWQVESCIQMHDVDEEEELDGMLDGRHTALARCVLAAQSQSDIDVCVAISDELDEHSYG